ncbi:MAG: hypothetical protein HFG04_00385 [Oscillibacter sp.]|nr:hypothetical protein [Oscillibacter sp.]
MKEKAKALFDKTKERLKSVSKKIWIAIAAVLVVLIVAIAMALTLNQTEYAVLVTQVSDTEASKILNFLSEQGVTNYKVEDGNTVLVPAGQESALKARILMADLNQTGNYYTENLSAFSTNEERLAVEKTALELKIAGVIRNFPNVVDATVNITPGENRAYILDSNNVIQASAGVILTMVEGEMLTEEQAASIQQFISNSVQGLEIESVSISDTAGNIYLTGDALNGDASAMKIQLQQAWENRTNTNIKKVLDPIFGEDNVKVAVTCEVEVDRITEQRTEIRLPEGAEDGRGIVSSERGSYYVGRPEEGLPGGVVGTESNSDLVEAVEAGALPQNGDTMIAGDKQIDYENSRSEFQIDSIGAGRVTDCTVAVTINSRTAGDFDVEDIRRHVARAAKIQGELDPVTGEEILDSKISVLAMEFYDPNVGLQPGLEPGGFFEEHMWIVIAAGVGLLLFIILLTVILLLRRKKRKQQQEQEERERRDMEAMMAAAGLGENGEAAAGADVMELEMERSMELRKDIRQFASDNPEIAAQMIKTWLKGGDGNG